MCRHAYEKSDTFYRLIRVQNQFWESIPCYQILKESDFDILPALQQK